VWTPKGKDWVWRRFISARKIPGYEVVMAKPFENRAILDAAPSYYEQLKHSYDDKFYRQEVLGEYLDMYGGAVYRSFDGQLHVARGTYNPSLPLIWSLDFNINPMASIIAQCDEAYGRKRVHVLQEIVLPDSHTVEMCREFLRRTAQWADDSPGPLAVHIYGDATGAARSASSGGDSNWSIIEKILASKADYKPSFRQQKRNPSITDRVNAVNGLLQSFAETHSHFENPRVLIDPCCTELLTDLETVVWKTDAHGAMIPELDKSDPRRTHVSDALGYYCEAAHGFKGMAKTIKHMF
jgi:hypothetical protein